MRLLRFSCLIFPFLLSGCALGKSLFFPYESKFKCEKTDDTGRCISVTEAYQDAVDDKRNDKLGGKPQKKARDSYKESEYREMKKLIDDPVTPLVKPPKVLRTLVVAYPSGKDTLFSHRYIWYFVDAGNFVLGDPLHQDFESAGSLLTPFAGTSGILK